MSFSGELPWVPTGIPVYTHQALGQGAGIWTRIPDSGKQASSPCRPRKPFSEAGAGDLGHPTPMRSVPGPLPGTEIWESASGWLSVSTLTCRKALHTGLCRCLQVRSTD